MCRLCALFTGHIGCGKSTELLRLKAELEDEGFHVIYFVSSDDLEMADVDISDVLLSIARRISESLEKIQLSPPATGFRGLLDATPEGVADGGGSESGSQFPREQGGFRYQQTGNVALGGDCRTNSDKRKTIRRCGIS